MWLEFLYFAAQPSADAPANNENKEQGVILYYKWNQQP